MSVWQPGLTRGGRLTGADGHGDAKGSQQYRHPELNCRHSTQRFWRPGSSPHMEAHHDLLIPPIYPPKKREGLVPPGLIQPVASTRFVCTYCGVQKAILSDLCQDHCQRSEQMSELTVKAARKAVTPMSHLEDLHLSNQGGWRGSPHHGVSLFFESNILFYEVI